MQRLKSHQFRGKRWRIRWPTIRGNAMGFAERPGATMDIDPRYCGLDLLETLIHESLHACLGDLDEEAVTSTARDVARFLWRIGYRLEEDID